MDRRIKDAPIEAVPIESRRYSDLDDDASLDAVRHTILSDDARPLL